MSKSQSRSFVNAAYPLLFLLWILALRGWSYACHHMHLRIIPRAMGPGYQARISRILGLWANMKIGEALRMEEAIYAQMKILNRLDRAAVERGERIKGFGADVEQDVLPDR